MSGTIKRLKGEIGNLQTTLAERNKEIAKHNQRMSEVDKTVLALMMERNERDERVKKLEKELEEAKINALQ